MLLPRCGRSCLGSVAPRGWSARDRHRPPLHFLNASHYKLGGSITFLGRDGVLHTRTIVRNVKVYQDVAIGTLAEPVPAGVHFFPVVPVVGAETVGREVLYVSASLRARSGSQSFG